MVLLIFMTFSENKSLKLGRIKHIFSILGLCDRLNEFWWKCLAVTVTGNTSFPFSMKAVFWKNRKKTVFYLSFRRDGKLYIRTLAIFVYANSQTRYESKSCWWMMLHLVAKYILHHVIMVVPWWDSSSLIVT